MNNEMDFLTDTILHRSEVEENLYEFISELIKRAKQHDRSKLTGIEFEMFSGTRDRFKKADYGTEEYNQLCEETKPAMESHYSNNRHHVAYHKNGIKDMNLIDILEMLADWFAALRRGDTERTLKDTSKHAFKKYGIGGDLKQVIENTLNDFGWYDVKK